jgi:hypothetical protein
VVRDVPHYGRLAWREVYPGIAAVFYGNRHRVEMDFELAPLADVERIRLRLEGAAARLEPDGSVVAGPMRLAPPRALQGDREVRVAFTVRGEGIGFALGRYDRSAPLRIDPVISASTYLGGDAGATGGGDLIRGAATDAAGNLYVAGATESATFPVTKDAAVATYKGGPWTMFLARFSPEGTLLYATYFGGDQLTIEPMALAADAAGNSYITGYSYAGNFPATAGAYQKTRMGGRDAFVVKLSPAGTVEYATLLGGESDDTGQAIAVDGEGNAYVGGATSSATFPVTEGALQTVAKGLPSGFVTKLSADGARLVYSTYLGGRFDTVQAIAVDEAGSTYAAGSVWSDDLPLSSDALRSKREIQDGFLTRLSPDGGSVWYSTLVGGVSSEQVRGVALAATGLVYLCGSTYSWDWKTTEGAWQRAPGGGADGFVMALDLNGPRVAALTYLGGSGADTALAVKVDTAGNVVVAGETASEDLVAPESAVQPKYGGGASDGFVAILGPELQAVSFTYVGGGGEDRLGALALDRTGDAWVGLNTLSPDLKTTEGAPGAQLAKGGWDGYVARIGALATWRISGTYLGGQGGGTGEQMTAVALDADGNVWVAGTSNSTDFPASEGAFQAEAKAGTDAVVSKLDARLGTLLSSTYLAGTGDDTAAALAVAGDGSVWVAGTTASADFPVTETAAMAKAGGSWDAWLARVSADGKELLYGTYFGGNSVDTGKALVAWPGGGVLLAGESQSWNLAVTEGALKTDVSSSDLMAARFDDGGRVVWAARFGGTSADTLLAAALGSGERPVLAGWTSSLDFPVTGEAMQAAHGGGGMDGFVLQLESDGRQLAWSTYVGGTGSEEVRAVREMEGGEWLVGGITNSRDFRTTAGAYQGKVAGSDDGFVMRLRDRGSGVVWSTVVGTTLQDRVLAMAVEPSGRILLGGSTNSTAFPVSQATAVQWANVGGVEGFVAELSEDGKTLPFATYLGGTGNDAVQAVALDQEGNPVLAGQTCSADFPVTEGGYQAAATGRCNGFVTRLDMAAPTPERQAPRVDTVTGYFGNTARINPGGVFQIRGANLARTQAEAGNPDSKGSGELPLALGGTKVYLVPGNAPMPLFSVSATRIVAQLPYGAPTTSAARVATPEGETIKGMQVTLEPQWVLLRASKADGSAITEQNRVSAGEEILLHYAGFVSRPDSQPPLGTPTPEKPDYLSGDPLPIVIVSAVPTPATGGANCTIVQARAAPGYIGVGEMRLRIPQNAGNSSGIWDLYFLTATGTTNKLRLYHVPVN